MIKKIPKIGLTTGDPAGIGPDILIKLAQYEYDAELVVIGDPYLLEDRAKKLNLRLKLNTFSQQKEPTISKRGELSIEEVTLKDKVVVGQLNVAHSDYVLKTLDKAISHCLIKKLDVLVTGPINKHSINTFLKSKKRNNQINFTGHTEYLAEKCNCPDVVMMLTDESKSFEQSKSKKSFKSCISYNPPSTQNGF